MAGASPNFSEVHVIRTLMLLSAGEMGRKGLVKVLGIGEGSVRTILKIFRREGFIRSSGRGQTLSERGRNHIREYLKKFNVPGEFRQTETGRLGSVIAIHKTADRIKTGFEQRDIAVNAGSESVLILKYKNGKLEFPTKDVRLSDFPDLIEGLKEFKFRKGDVVVLSFAKTYPKAEDGALAVALDLIR